MVRRNQVIRPEREIAQSEQITMARKLAPSLPRGDKNGNPPRYFVLGTHSRGLSRK